MTVQSCTRVWHAAASDYLVPLPFWPLSFYTAPPPSPPIPSLSIHPAHILFKFVLTFVCHTYINLQPRPLSVTGSRLQIWLSYSRGNCL